MKKFSNKIFYQKKNLFIKKFPAFAYIKNNNSLQKLFYKKKANKKKIKNAKLKKHVIGLNQTKTSSTDGQKYQAQMDKTIKHVQIKHQARTVVQINIKHGQLNIKHGVTFCQSMLDFSIFHPLIV
jgi:hypothetical protein